jgi:hypothetical protein
MNKRWIPIVVCDRPHVHRTIGGSRIARLAVHAEVPLELENLNTVGMSN